MLQVPPGCILSEISLKTHPIISGNNEYITVYCNQFKCHVLVPAIHTTDEDLTY
jgi:hypothetical protein